MGEPRGTEPPRLSGWPGRPYRVRIAADAQPEAIIADLLGDDHPGALWGNWFGGGVLLFRAPLRVHEPEQAPEAFAALEDQPSLAGPAEAGLVGGGWLVALGYAPGATTTAFYDSLLRWRAAEGWSFESLGLQGRETANAAALAQWQSELSAAADPPATDLVTTAFQTVTDVAATRARYLSGVEDVIGRIHRGDFYQMNLCLRLYAQLGQPPSAVFARVAGQLQPAYAGLVSGPAAGQPRIVASFSPELFLRVRGRRVTTAPIKGTAPRTAAGEAALRSSAKDSAENVMIVDLMRNDLSRVCRPGTVTVDELLGVEPHPGVWHLVSKVHGELADQVGTAGLLQATFPPGSVTGAPKLAAQQGIAELETESRGAYTGALGLISPAAGTDLSVIIRTFEVAGDKVELGVGGGITVDSVPIREWYECLHKAAPLVAAAGARLAEELVDEPGPPDPALVASGVFESVLVSRGEAVRLAGHLARLDRSCRELFGLGLPDGLVTRIRQNLAGTASGPPIALRIAARLDSGSLALDLTTRPLAPRTTRCALVQASRLERVWRHKWVDRAVLERAEQLSQPALPYFTRDGSIAETSRGNLFWLSGAGQWCTPPLDEAVLPGVTRREVLNLLAERGCPVRVVPGTVSELQQANGAFWTSSLSGAVAVDSVDDHPLQDSTRFAAELTELLGAGDR